MKQAARTQKEITADTVANPFEGERTDLVGQAVAQPFTLSPLLLESAFQNRAAEANNAANAFLDDSLASATGATGQGARSGSIVNARQLAGGGLGQSLSNNRQQLEFAGAQQNRADLLSVFDLINAEIQAQNAPKQNEVNTLSGLGQILAQSQQQQGGGVGQLAGQLIGQIGGAVIGGPAGSAIGGTAGSGLKG